MDRPGAERTFEQIGPDHRHRRPERTAADRISAATRAIASSVSAGRIQSRRSETLRPFRDRIAVCYGDLRDAESLAAALTEHPADEIYNFAAQSQPGLSWQKAVETGEVNGIGAHRLFETVRRMRPQARIFQASSSDMFGTASESPQRETTPFRPNNPYSVAKLYAHQTAGIYRAHHGAYIACGILLQSREPLSRHGLHQPEDHVRRGLRQARHPQLGGTQRARRADGQGRQARSAISTRRATGATPATTSAPCG